MTTSGLSTFQKESEGEYIELYIFNIFVKIVVKILFKYFKVNKKYLYKTVLN